MASCNFEYNRFIKNQLFDNYNNQMKHSSEPRESDFANCFNQQPQAQLHNYNMSPPQVVNCVVNDVNIEIRIPAINVPISDDQGRKKKKDKRKNTAPAKKAKKTEETSPRRVRTHFTNFQVITLESEFQEDKYVQRTKRIRLATILQLDERQIKIWFQNRRMKDKKNPEKIPTKKNALSKPMIKEPASTTELSNNSCIINQDCQPQQILVPQVLGYEATPKPQNSQVIYQINNEKYENNIRLVYPQYSSLREKNYHNFTCPKTDSQSPQENANASDFQPNSTYLSRQNSYINYHHNQYQNIQYNVNPGLTTGGESIVVEPSDDEYVLSDFLLFKRRESPHQSQ